MKVLIVDCYDSFTYNLYQQVGKLGAEPVVLSCDTPVDVVKRTPCERIILSPGPGTPDDAGVCPDVLETMSRKIPTLGVCLGHQVICTAFGGEVVRAPHLMHGKTSAIQHTGTGIFSRVPTPFVATRYHSLIARDASLPDDLEITATSTDDGYVMGVRHRSYPIDGVQFHPESVLSTEGDHIIRNFLFGAGVGS
ncbi:anthranilate synthase component II [Methanoregula formicica]|uniref:anthranilate synthase n=1 Tax=Methanoregula formicica (strain DSM 22288 / NBRC 105244 / SMSP) TaxID=593750 RepID=L0HGJ5_METFS|nr:aminodeoxychorismate/anthranilate synthase component II [Methanoregula formicica]AGB03867.1 glutamine amidotransferase of anthranilate synthase or aminodeoxychorismate synthase [Methanoregula formicica SMSP]